MKRLIFLVLCVFFLWNHPKDRVSNGQENQVNSLERRSVLAGFQQYFFNFSTTLGHQPLYRQSFKNQTNDLSASSTSPTNSVLAAGEWFRFYVEKSGVFRLDRRFLVSLGMDVANIDPRNLKIYGNGGRTIPLINQEVQHYDVAENAISVIGEQDGRFDDTDAVVFYAEGPDNYVEENQSHINVYTDRTYYYITASGGNGKRIREAVQPLSPTTSYNTYDAYRYVEEDLANIISAGRRWFGDVFSVERTKTYSFDFPNRLTDTPVFMTADLAATATSETSLIFSIDGAATTLPVSLPALPSGGEQASILLARGSGIKTSQPIIVGGGDIITVTATYDDNGNPNNTAYLDYLIVEATCQLSGTGNQFNFQIKDITNNLGAAQINLSNAQQIQAVWNVTDIYNVASYTNSVANANFSFNVQQGQLQTFVVVDQNDYFSPSIDNNPRLENQNIKGTVFTQNGEETAVDYLIFTSEALLSAANRLADFHRQTNNLQVRVYSLQKIYNEFNTGNPDIGAIRNFIKYVYDNAPTPTQRLKYVCLFGDTTYDYKNRIQDNNNIVPTWYSLNSFSLLDSVMSDDFYGLMDPHEGSVTRNNDLLDIAVGRILTDNLSQANKMVDKIISYNNQAAFGSWRNNLILLSDDMDHNWEWELEQTVDRLGDILATQKPFVNLRKIHADAFQQTSSAGGDRYEGATQQLLNDIELGALTIVYLGHGSEDGLAGERLFQKADAQTVFNPNKLNVFLTATCEFTRFDNPARTTAGELTYWNEQGGSVGLITTTRRIFARNGISYSELILNYMYRFGAVGPDTNYDSVAEALRKAKNDPAFTGSLQKRVLFFIGDPAMKLAIPQLQVNLTHINDRPINSVLDTLKALGRVKLRGNVTNATGNLIPNFSGTVSVNVFGKNINRRTLANDRTVSSGSLRDELPDGTPIIGPTIYRMPFVTSGETIFRGQASVDPSDSSFEFQFVVPRDIPIAVGNGRASFYATNQNRNADYTGVDTHFLVGELDETAPEDNIGPTIQLFMNDQNFVSGSITNNAPVLIALLEDENGINTVGGIGHDITAVLDQDESSPVVLNDYYQADKDSFSSGSLSFPFRDLEPGMHTITLKAWDVYNNSTTAEIQFVVVSESEIKIENVLNYPNPFTSYTEFWFQHNRPSEPLDVLVQVFTISGKLVWSQTNQIATQGFLSRDITWNGRDDFGNRIGKGVYIYKITVKSTFTNQMTEKTEKLTIL